MVLSTVTDHGRMRGPVVGIMGSGRSGSTLLEFLLAANLDDARALGELETLVVRGLRDNEVCSCARRALDCPAWTKALEQLAAHPGRGSWEAAVEDRRRRLWWGTLVYGSALRRRVTGTAAGAGPNRLEGYAAMLAVLSTVSAGPGPLIDNSKTPLHFFALAGTGRVDLRMVHLLRRPQAVVWSWKRRKHLPESGDRNWYMEPRSALASGSAWLFDALMAASFRWLHPAVPFVRISYEELCADPRATLAKCARALHLPALPRPQPPSGYHALGGNPARFGGFGQVQLDDEWRGSLSRPVRMMVDIIASPVYRLLLRQGGRR